MPTAPEVFPCVCKLSPLKKYKHISSALCVWPFDAKSNGVIKETSRTNLTIPRTEPFKVDFVSDAKCQDRVFAAVAPRKRHKMNEFNF